MQKLLPVVIASMLITFAWIDSSQATNGMDMEGYGPIAQSMGGTSIARNNGTAAVINNPATLSLMPDGSNRIDIAFGILSPNIKATKDGYPAAYSSADAFFMPAMGWSARNGKWTYGLGIFGQGGMGTDYSATSFLALNSGDDVRSEVSVGRFIIPISYQVNNKFTIAGSLDLLWAGMDLKMAMPAPVGQQMITGQPTLALPKLGATDWMRVDFSNDSQFTGEAKGYGADIKIGATYAVMDNVRIGAMYHAQPNLGDLESDNGTISFGSMVSGQQAGIVSGKVKVKDFRWPALAGAGIAWDATDRLLLAFDFRYIFWKDAMEDMTVKFTADNGGGDVQFTLPQNWSDQAVYEFGAAFKATDALTLRGGYNYGANPVPDNLTNPLFPATTEHHISGGIGYKLSNGHSIDLSVVYVPENKVTNADGITISHQQVNGQLMYSMFF
jgi:long-chain fatty acid transport protein